MPTAPLLQKFKAIKRRSRVRRRETSPEGPGGPSRVPRGGACGRGRSLSDGRGRRGGGVWVEGAGLPAFLLTSGSDNGRKGPSEPEVNVSSFVAHSSAAEVEAAPPSSPPSPPHSLPTPSCPGRPVGCAEVWWAERCRYRRSAAGSSGPGRRPVPQRWEPPRQESSGGTIFWIGREQRFLFPGEGSNPDA